MDESDVSSAIEAAISIATELDLPADTAVVLHNSNKLALRLLPCDAFARVAHAGHEVARFEIELASRLADDGAPVAALEARVEPRLYERDGYAMTFWTHYDQPTPARGVSPREYAGALGRLHAVMRHVDIASPHFLDRVTEAEQLVMSRARTPELVDADRDFLLRTLLASGATIKDSGAPEQLLHGEPHPGNVLTTKNGPLFIDLETCCRGPVEFDLAHVPEEVSEHYVDIDHELLRECRRLVLAMVTAWRWDADDQFPDGERWGWRLLDALRNGPPWPTLGRLADDSGEADARPE